MRAFGFELAVAVLPILGREPPVPANPAFAEDVGPIFAARCVRCHGETLRGDPGQKVADQCYLNRFDDTGDCSSGSTTCQRGALFCAYEISARISTDDPYARMPPPPADPLSDWAKEVVTRWAANPSP